MIKRIILATFCLFLFLNASYVQDNFIYDSKVESLEQVIDRCYENNNLSCVYSNSEKIFELANSNKNYTDALSSLNWKIYYALRLEDYANYPVIIKESLDYINHLIHIGIEEDTILYSSKYYNKYLLFYYYSRVGQYGRALDSMKILFNDISQNEKYAFQDYKSIMLQNLSDLSRNTGKYNLAINYANEHLNLLEEKNIPTVAAHNILSNIYSKIKDYDRAIYHNNKAYEYLIKNKQTVLNWEITLRIINIVRLEILIESKNYIEAKKVALETIKELTKYKHLKLSDVYIQLAQAQYNLGELQEALKTLTLIENELKKKEYSSHYFLFAKTNLLKADIMFTLKKYEDANQSYNNALSYLKDSHTYNKVDTSSTTFLLMYAPAITGTLKTLVYVENTEDYRKYIQRIIHVLDYSRKNFSDEYDKYTLTTILYKAIEESLDFVSNPKINDSKLAFTLIERAKSLNLLDSYNSANINNQNNIDPIYIKEESLQRDLKLLAQKMHEQKELKTDKDYFSTQISDVYIKTIRELDSIKNIIQKKNPEYYKLKYNPTIAKLEDINKNLSKEKAIIQYITGEKNVYALYIHKDKTTFNKLNISSDELNKKCNLYFENLLSPLSGETNNFKQNILAYNSLSNELYKILIGDIIPINTNLKHLIFCADGVLNDLPFETLLTRKVDNPITYRSLPYLINDYAVSYIFSATLYKMMKENKAEKPSKILAFAPDFKMSYSAKSYMSPIPSNKSEVNFISKLVRTKIFQGKKSKKENFIKDVNDYEVIHMASHGFSDNINPNNSYISFSQYGNEINPEEKLYIRDIYNYRINAEMVVLSACETNLGQYKRGEGVYSLSRSFAYAGCNSIVTSLWKVNQKMTEKTMKGFYTHLKNGQDKAESLRDTKLKLIQENSITAHPYYWAGFIVLGNEEALVLAKPNVLVYYQKILIIIGVLAFSTLIVLYHFHRKRTKMTL